jgi:hypothetical protein
MFRRNLRTVTFTALLLTTTALAPPALASPRAAEPASPSRLVELTRSYLAALNHGLATGSFSGLAAIVAPGATLTERSSLSREAQLCCATTVRGRSAIVRFYRRLSADVPGRRWIVGVMNQVSPTTMVVYTRASEGPHAPALYSSHRVAMNNGEIVSLTLTLYYLQ